MGDQFGPHWVEDVILAGGRGEDVVESEMVLIEMDLVLGECENGVGFLAWPHSHKHLDGVVAFGIHSNCQIKVYLSIF